MKKRLLFTLMALAMIGSSVFALKPINVVHKYMSNDTLPFQYTNKYTAGGELNGEFYADDIVNNNGQVTITIGTGPDAVQVQIPRFHRLAGPWVTKNDVNTVDANGNPVATTWHVDLQKMKGALTITSQWDDFAPTFNNVKVQQPLKAALPAGKYDFTASWAQDRTGAKYTFLVVTKGTEIPDTATLIAKSDPNVLGYVRLSDSLKVSFDLAASTQLTVGLVASFPEPVDAGYCVALGNFSLLTWIPGTNYLALQDLYKIAAAMTSTQYTVGTTGGKYPAAYWDAFVTARTDAKTILDNMPKGDPLDPNFKETATQSQVDAALAALKKAITDLKASMILPFQLSTDAKSFYYKIHDKRNPSNYWVMMEDYQADGITKINRLKITQEVPTTIPETMMFKIVKKQNTTDNSFYIYNKAYPEHALSINPSNGNLIQIDASAKDTTWNIMRTPAGDELYFSIYLVAQTAKQLNSYANQGFIGMWNPGSTDDPGNDWKFDRYYFPGEVNFGALNDLLTKTSNMLKSKYTFGTGPYQFSESAWNSFESARTTANNVASTEMTGTPATQAQVDQALADLQASLDAFMATKGFPFQFSTATEEFYYYVHDKRGEVANSLDTKKVARFWYIGDELDASGALLNSARLLVSDSLQSDKDVFKFKFMKNTAAADNSFFIYNKAFPTIALSVVEPNSGTISALEGGTPDAFILGTTPANDVFYNTITAVIPNKQLNSDYAHHKVLFWNPSSDDPGNDWKFAREWATGVKTIKETLSGIYSKDGRILSKDVSDELSVFNVSGQKLNEKTKLAPGIYIVTAKGKQGAAKVVVK